MKSLSEIETVSKRATKAAGFSWGVAEEVGKNIRIIEMYGLPGIKNLNDYFKKKKETNFENLNLINTNNKSVKSKICPIIAGRNFLDQIKTLEVLNEIKFEKIGYPLLFLPFLSRGSEVVGKRIFVKFDEKEFLLNFNNNIYSNFLDNEINNGHIHIAADSNSYNLKRDNPNSAVICMGSDIEFCMKTRYNQGKSFIYKEDEPLVACVVHKSGIRGLQVGSGLASIVLLLFINSFK